VGDQLRVDFRLADFLDVEADITAHHALQVSAQRLDVLALLADDHTGTRAMNRDAGVLSRALDGDLRYRGVRQLLAQVFADADVLRQRRCIVLAVRVPLRRPVPVDGKTETGRIDLLTHDLLIP